MILTVTSRPWETPEVPAPLPEPRDAARGITATNRAFFTAGTGVVPVSGEIHFSRVPRERWAERLQAMKALGITHAATYVFWNHHVPVRGRADFTGGLDVAGFIDACADAGLDVVLRIGPWAHGESRNGGFPDWVQQAPVLHRTDDPAYLELVREWFGQLAAALDGRAVPGGAITAIQLENELYDQSQHLVTLKALAREAGMSAPLWTATGWGGADLPDGEVLPVFGGYADGFWADPDAPLDPTFRAHFFPSHDWDDPGVGADVRASQGIAAATAAASATADLHGFAPATCELGSGMATAYHRRPRLTPCDVAALAHNKIGNGSAWQGYYMFSGGRNPGPDLQETIASGYPNDLPEFGYDFHAPIGQSGDLDGSAALLRDQHAFLATFGPLLAGMTSSLPDERPRDLDDRTTLRWALRSNETSGFAIITHHQPHDQVAPVPDASLQVYFATDVVTLPTVTIPAGTLARWPLRLPVGEAIVEWATASALTVLPGDVPTLVLREDAGIAPVIQIGESVSSLTAGTHEFPGMRVLLVGAEDPIWVIDTPAGRRLLRTENDIAATPTVVRTRGIDAVEEYRPDLRGWDVIATTAPASTLSPVRITTSREASTPATDYGFGGVRHRAPGADVLDTAAAIFVVDLPAGATAADADAVLDIDWAGDVAQLRVDDRVVDDRFWDGSRWSVALADVGARETSRITLHVLPISRENSVWLAPEPAARRRAATEAGLSAVDAITLRGRGSWRPAG